MIEPHLVEAIAPLLAASGVQKHACLFGGQAIRDLQASLMERIGPEIPEARTSRDIDLLIAFRRDPRTDTAFAAALSAGWEQPDPARPSYTFRANPAIVLDLAETYETQQAAGTIASIRTGGKSREVWVYRLIPQWLMSCNLTEPCHEAEFQRLGLERLRHTALLATKLLAVHASVSRLREPVPPSWTERLDRDIRDVEFLVDESIRSNLWCTACTAKRDELHEGLRRQLGELQSWSERPMKSYELVAGRLKRLMLSRPQWW